MAGENESSLDWMRQIQAQIRAGQTENGVLRGIYKRAKAAGENLEAHREVIKQLKRREHEEVILFFRECIRLAMLRGVPFSPSALFDDLDTQLSNAGRHAEDLWAAGERGYRDGFNGLTLEDSPYGPGTELHAEYARNMSAGRSAKQREVGPDGIIAGASRARPNRETQEALPGVPAARKAARKKSAARKRRKMPARKKAAANGSTDHAPPF